jgi:hypothetical protein
MRRKGATVIRLDLLNRTIIAVVLVALAVTLGVWMTRSPLTATPAAAPIPPPVKPAPTEVLHEPTLAPLPPSAILTPSATTTEVQIEVEIAPLPGPPAAPIAADPSATEPTPAATPTEPKPEPQSGRQQPRRWGLFRRR